MRVLLLYENTHYFSIAWYNIHSKHVGAIYGTGEDAGEGVIVASDVSDDVGEDNRVAVRVLLINIRGGGVGRWRRWQGCYLLDL